MQGDVPTDAVSLYWETVTLQILRFGGFYRVLWAFTAGSHEL